MRKPRQPCDYMLASKRDRDGVLYVGVTSDISNRVSMNKQRLLGGFTSRHKIERLVYFELHDTMPEAIQREKQIKKWNRAWKVRLIEQVNPEWRDLWCESDEVRSIGEGGQGFGEPAAIRQS